MAEGDSTAAAAGGTNSGTAPQPISVTIPDTWAADDNFKGFFKEGEGGAKAFDLDGFQKHYIETKQALPVVPETADAYKFDYPEGWPVDEAEVKLHREMALSAKLTPQQYETIVKHDIARMSRVAEDSAKKLEEARVVLKKEYGQSYQANIEAAKKAVSVVFGEDVAKAFNIESETDPRVIRGLVKLAKSMSEDKLKLGGLPAGDDRPVGVDGRPIFKSYSQTMKKSA